MRQLASTCVNCLRTKTFLWGVLIIFVRVLSTVYYLTSIISEYYTSRDNYVAVRMRLANNRII